MFTRSLSIASRAHRQKHTLKAFGVSRWDALSSLTPGQSHDSVFDMDDDSLPTWEAEKPKKEQVDWRVRFRGRSPSQQQQAQLQSQRPRFPSRRARDSFYGHEEIPGDITETEMENLVKLACTDDGSRRLRAVIPKANLEILEHMAEQIYNDPRPIGLLKNEHCGRVIRCLMEFGDHELRWALGNLVHGNMWNLCMHKHGNFVIDGVLVLLNVEQRAKLVAELLSSEIDIQRCAKHWHGRFPLKNIIERGSSEERSLIAVALKGSISKLSTHLHGRRTIQTCVKWFEGEDRDSLIAELLGVKEATDDNLNTRIDSALQLAKHEHGTFVMQTLLESSPDDQQFLLAAMKGHVKELALDPLATYLVDSAIRHMDSPALAELVAELSKSSGSNTYSDIVDCAHDQSGSIVVRSFLQNGFASQRVVVAKNMCGHALSLAMSESGHKCVNCVVQGAEHTDDVVFGSYSGALDEPEFGANSEVDMGLDRESVEQSEEFVESSDIDCEPVSNGRGQFNVVRDQFMKELLASHDNVSKLSLNEFGSVVLTRILEWGTEDEMVAVFEGLKASKSLLQLTRTEHGSKLLDSTLHFLAPLERDELVDVILFGQLTIGDEQVEKETVDDITSMTPVVECVTGSTAGTTAVVEDEKKVNRNHWTSDLHAAQFVRSLLKGGTKDQCSAIVASLKGKMAKLVRDPESRGMVVDVLRFADNTEGLVLELFTSSENAIVELALDPIATKVIGYLLENGLHEHQLAIAGGMKGHMADLAVTKEGSRIVQASFKVLAKDTVDELLDELLVEKVPAPEGVVQPPTQVPGDDTKLGNSSGKTQVLVEMSSSSHPSQTPTPVITDPAGNLIRFMKTKYSNILIQVMIRHGTDEHRRVIFDSLHGRMADLSAHKHGCFIVQSAMERSLSDESPKTAQLITELTDNSEALKKMYRSKHGKYVLNMILEHGSKLDVYAVEKAIGEEVLNPGIELE